LASRARPSAWSNAGANHHRRARGPPAPGSRLPAPFGALLGIPGGIGIYDAAKNGGGATTVPSALWLVAMVVLTVLVIAVLTAIPTLMASTTSVRPRIVRKLDLPFTQRGRTRGSAHPNGRAYGRWHRAVASGLLPRLASPISGGCRDYWRTLLQRGVLSSPFRTQCVEAGRLTDRGHRTSRLLVGGARDALGSTLGRPKRLCDAEATRRRRRWRQSVRPVTTQTSSTST
jgi:hypothetical protein